MDDQHAATGDNQPAMFFWPIPDRNFVSHGKGIYLYDEQGRRYIDAASGPQTANIGHADPRVVEAMREQAAKVSYTFPNHFRNRPAEGLARDIADLSPFDLDRVFFCSGGSEAVEACVKLARQYAVASGETARYKIISRLPSYHGSTLGALSLTGDPAFFSMFSPMMVNQPKIPAPFCHYRPAGETADQAALRFADMLQEEIVSQGAETVLAFIMEPIGGAATGALTAPAAYYRRVREICDRHGVLLIFDEVMSGSGRSGKFLAAEHWQVRPDIVALAKGLGAGYTPLGACLTSARVLAVVEAAGGFMHGHTYSGNPLSCAIGRAVLGVMRDDKLVENAAKMGARLKSALHEIAADYAFIGEVKGEGLLLGFDIVANSRTGEALPPELMAYEKISQAAYDLGLIIYSRRIFDGIKGDQFLVSPPLIVGEADVDEIAGLLRQALDAFLPDAAPYLA